MDLESVAAELYGASPEWFTAAREELAKRARSGGQRELAGQIRRLRKPTMGAWVVNLLARERPEEVDRLLELGEQLRAAQTGLKGEELRALSRQRTQVVSALARQGRRLASDTGHPVSEAIEREVESTLEAGLADPEAAAAVRSGQLAKTLAFSGFGGVDVSDAVAAPVRRPSGQRRPPPGERGAARDDRAPQQQVPQEQAQQERAQRDLADAEDEARRLDQAEEEARSQEDAARARRREIDERIARLEAELDRAKVDAADAARGLRGATKEAERAQRNAAAARRRVEQARSRLDRLSRP